MHNVDTVDEVDVSNCSFNAVHSDSPVLDVHANFSHSILHNILCIQECLKYYAEQILMYLFCIIFIAHSILLKLKSQIYYAEIIH